MTQGDTSPQERAGTATEIGEALHIPPATIRAYAHEGAIEAVGMRGRQPLYDGRQVARVRAQRRATMREWRAA